MEPAKPDGTVAWTNPALRDDFFIVRSTRGVDLHYREAWANLLAFTLVQVIDPVPQVFDPVDTSAGLDPMDRTIEIDP